jgi:hypothetical protein
MARPGAFASGAAVTATYSFRTEGMRGSGSLVMCGRDNSYQVQIQDALNSSIRLLAESADPRIAPDADLAALAREVNEFFEPKAKALLHKKRRELRDAGHPEAAARCEFTAFLTASGVQLGYSYAMERKEIAPVPRKSLLRQALGPFSLGRVQWTMPEHSGSPGVYRKVTWPWAFWALLLLLAVFLGWSAAEGSLAAWVK